MKIVDLDAESALVIVTIGLVVATIALVIATILIAGYNKKMWIAQDKPWLYFKTDLDPILRSGRELYITNVGKGVALDVKFTILNGTLNETCSIPILPLKENLPSIVIEVVIGILIKK